MAPVECSMCLTSLVLMTKATIVVILAYSSGVGYCPIM